jgi:hypothetical protein
MAIMAVGIIYVILHQQIPVTEKKPPEAVTTTPALPQQKKKPFPGPFPSAGIKPPLPARDKDIFSYPDGHFSFILPTGWKRVPNNIVNKYIERLLKELKGKAKPPKYDFVFNLKAASWPFESPYFIITIFKMVVNDKTIENELISIQKEFKKFIKKEDIKNIYKEALIGQPIYDKEKKIIIFSVDSKLLSFDGKEIFQTMIVAINYYKEGAIAIYFYCNKSIIKKYLSDFKIILNSFTIDEEYQYK